MLKVTYICDKCGEKHESEIKAGSYPGPTPKNEGKDIGWQVIELKWDTYGSLSKLLCNDCLSKVGFKGKAPIGDNYQQRESNAEKMVDLLLEIAEEKGCFNRD